MKKCAIAVVILAGILISNCADAQVTDTLTKINAAGKVVMGVRESAVPLSYQLGDGRYTGYHVELCERILKAIVPAARIEYAPVTTVNRILLVQNGTVDIECGATTNNAARQRQVAFAVTTYVSEMRMAVKAYSTLSSISQLGGKNIVTTTGTTAIQSLRKNEKAASLDFREVYGKDHADSFQMLETARADTFVTDEYILASNIANAKSPADFRIVGEVLSVEPNALVLRKDDPAFKKAVDDAIKSLIKNGDLGKLYNRWFLSPIPPRNISLNLPMGNTFKGLLANPNDDSVEAYVKN